MNENTDFSAEVQNKLDALPADIKAFVYSADMSKTIQDIGAKYKLHVDQIGALESEAAAVMIGLTKPEKFAENISDALGAAEPQSQEIAKDVNDLLFLRIREAMKKSSAERSVPASAPDKMPLAVAVPLNSISQSAAPILATPPTTITPTAPVLPSMPTTPTAAAVIGPTTTVIAKPTTPPPLSPDMHTAEVVMSNTIVQAAPTMPAAPAAPTAPVDPAQPLSYKADPYREPVE